ncbi:MAG: hypothetical protein J4G09_01325, partial [Proteobacteria bacterium]|nr:hypothetical protein [Pseudomonadota bacterium]
MGVEASDQAVAGHSHQSLGFFDRVRGKRQLPAQLESRRGALLQQRFTLAEATENPQFEQVQALQKRPTQFCVGDTQAKGIGGGRRREGLSCHGGSV